MKMVKSLLLGSAAAVLLVASSQGAIAGASVSYAYLGPEATKHVLAVMGVVKQDFSGKAAYVFWPEGGGDEQRTSIGAVMKMGSPGDESGGIKPNALTMKTGALIGADVGNHYDRVAGRDLTSVAVINRAHAPLIGRTDAQITRQVRYKT